MRAPTRYKGDGNGFSLKQKFGAVFNLFVERARMLWKRYQKWRGRGFGEKGVGGKGGDGWVWRRVGVSAGKREVVFVACLCICIPYVVVLYMFQKKGEVPDL